jgi:hypothetical protein
MRNALDSSDQELVNELAPLLPPAEWPRVLRHVADGLGAPLEEYTLTLVASHLPSQLMRRAVEIASSYPPNIFRKVALEALAPYLRPGAARAVLPAAREIAEPHYRADVLTALVPGLPDEAVPAVLAEIRAAIREMDPPAAGDLAQRWRWRDLILLLPAAERPGALAEATKDEDPEGHADLLTDLAYLLPAGERGPFLAEAERVVPDIPGWPTR